MALVNNPSEGANMGGGNYIYHYQFQASMIYNFHLFVRMIIIFLCILMKKRTILQGNIKLYK